MINLFFRLICAETRQRSTRFSVTWDRSPHFSNFCFTARATLTASDWFRWLDSSSLRLLLHHLYFISLTWQLSLLINKIRCTFVAHLNKDKPLHRCSPKSLFSSFETPTCFSLSSMLKNWQLSEYINNTQCTFVAHFNIIFGAAFKLGRHEWFALRRLITNSRRSAFTGSFLKLFS